MTITSPFLYLFLRGFRYRSGGESAEIGHEGGGPKSGSPGSFHAL